ncbi:MAG: MFS transporter [Bacteroidales bacterium]|nr:MFS transporter [Bacteroidales bacterium]
MKNKILTKTVLLLSWVSLFTDISSEMLYPVIPIFLASMHYSAAFIGTLEGIAEFIAGLSKGYFGLLSDKLQRRLPFVQTGYMLSALAKPLMILIPSGWWVLLTRTLDRFGKGIRTASRDAMLSAEATPETKGRVFGFHRSMDTLGAAIGPTIALVFLWLYPSQYKWLFFAALIPGLVTFFFLFQLKEKRSKMVNSTQKVSFFSFFKYIKQSPQSYRFLLVGLLTFALFNSSDMFLLLKAKELQLTDTQTIALYIGYNLAYALLSLPAGILADKIGLNRVFLMGVIVFSLVYAGFAFASSLYMLIFLFTIYGFYAAATEGIAKAWISNLVEKNEVASAIGSYTALQSIAALLASIFAGIIWTNFGSQITFLLTASISALVFVYFILINSKVQPLQK